MTERNVQIKGWATIVEMVTNAPAIYLRGINLEEVELIILNHEKLSFDLKMQAKNILEKAKTFNACLNETYNYPEKGKMRFCFEFKAWKDFLGFNEAMNKLSQR